MAGGFMQQSPFARSLLESRAHHPICHPEGLWPHLCGVPMKRITLFLLTNLAVVVVLGIVASLLGVNRYLAANGLNLGSLLGFAFVMGFGGAIISLLISKPMAKWSAGVQVIEQPRNQDEVWMVETVR